MKTPWIFWNMIYTMVMMSHNRGDFAGFCDGITQQKTMKMW
jgi:hypothetical protein